MLSTVLYKSGQGYIIPWKVFSLYDDGILDGETYCQLLEAKDEMDQIFGGRELHFQQDNAKCQLGTPFSSSLSRSTNFYGTICRNRQV